jgi:hypothetical protein
MSPAQHRLIGWLLIGVFALAVVVDNDLPGRIAVAFADFAQELSVTVRGWAE